MDEDNEENEICERIGKIKIIIITMVMSGIGCEEEKGKDDDIGDDECDDNDFDGFMIMVV